MYKAGYILLSVSWLLLLVAAVSCREKGDDSYPTVKVIQPQGGSTYSFGDTLHFKAVFTDDRQITNAELEIVDMDNKPVMYTVSISPGQNPFTFEGEYYINDPMLTGGPYQLRFRATDGSNVSNSFVPVSIFETARDFLYPLVVTGGGQGNHTIYRLTADSGWVNIGSFDGEYGASAVNSPARQFYYSGTYNSYLQALRLPHGAPLWNVKSMNHQSQRWFEYMSFEYPYLYVAVAEGNVRAINKTGDEIYKTATFKNAFPGCMAVTQNFLLTGFKDDFSNDRFLVANHISGGGFIYSKFMTGVVAGIVATGGDEAIVFSNNDAGGEISFYNGQDNSLALIHPFAEGNFTKVLKMDDNNLIVSATTGLYRYQISNNSLTTFVSASKAAPFAVDDINRLVYVCNGKTLEVYSFPFTNLIESYSLPDSAIAIHTVYTK